MKNSLKIYFIVLLLGLIALQLVAMKSMHYTSSKISWHSIEEGLSETRPSPNFEIGDMQFNVEKYKSADELKPFREYFDKTCKNLEGIKAASCLSESFVEKVPFGTPSDELFFPSYSPVDEFEKHLNGKPGHCVSYSGITTTSLLSVGIPARMVQILSEEKDGHNIIEVWDEKEGWVAFDPLSDTLLRSKGEYVSALEAVSTKTDLEKVEAGKENPTKGYLSEYYDGKTPFDKAITYPEPWLYTHVGEKESLIFRGTFVAFGEGYWEYGGLQTWFRYGVILFSILLLLASLSLIKSLYSKVLN